MSPALDTMPPATKAAALRAVLAMKHNYEKGNVAAQFHITIAELQTLIDRNGGTNRSAMAAKIKVLEVAGNDTTSEQQTDPAPPEGEDAPEAAGRLVKVPVNRLIPDPDNPRDTLNGIEELAETIQDLGLLQPIVARTSGPQLIVVAGHRRLAAVKYLRWTHVDVIIRPSMRPDDVIAAMLVENGQRADLDPIEEARGLKRLEVTGALSETALARKVGRSLAYVNGRLLLLTLPVEEQEKIRAGELGLTAATKKARIDAGRARPGAVGRPAIGHLSATHALATRAGNRCTSHGHQRGKGKGVGGVACGVCWEAVIRSDEREHLHDHSARTGSCGVCGQAMPEAEEQGA